MTYSRIIVPKIKIIRNTVQPIQVEVVDEGSRGINQSKKFSVCVIYFTKLMTCPAPPPCLQLFVLHGTFYLLSGALETVHYPLILVFLLDSLTPWQSPHMDWLALILKLSDLQYLNYCDSYLQIIARSDLLCCVVQNASLGK